jgi:hypothetical protein
MPALIFFMKVNEEGVFLEINILGNGGLLL